MEVALLINKSKRINSQSIFLLIIFAFSIMTLTFAFNIYFVEKNLKEKEIDFLSDDYYLVSFDENNPKIEELNTWKEFEEKSTKVYTMSVLSNKTAIFDKDFLNKVDIVKKLEENFDLEDAVALVAEEAENRCFEENGHRYIKVRGIKFLVIGFFSQHTERKFTTTDSILNQNASLLKENQDYEYVILDPDSKDGVVDIVERFKSKFPNATLSKWDGRQSDIVSSIIYIFLLPLAVGIIICINCIGLTDEWIRGYYYEIAIRRLIGSSNTRNCFRFIKKYTLLFSFSLIIGLGIYYIVYYIIQNLDFMESIRYSIGNHIYFESVMFSSVLVYIIGIVVLIIKLLKINRKEVKELMYKI